MEKYGFVYIWRDRKYPRFYIGSHWGTETDGYVCSSRWMRNTYKRRPADFKRRILARVYTSKQDLLLAEGRWLSLISLSEIGQRYYNLHNAQPGHWTATENSLSIAEKISQSVKGFKWYTNGTDNLQLRDADEIPYDFSRGRTMPSEFCEKLSAGGKRHWSNPKARKAQSERTTAFFEAHPEAKEAAREKTLEQLAIPGAREEMGRSQKKRLENPEARKVISDSLKIFNKAHPEAKEIHSRFMKAWCKGNPKPIPEHGTPARYQHHHCRCDLCRKAQSEYARGLRAKAR